MRKRANAYRCLRILGMVGAACAFFASFAAHANLILNGSFEEPLVPIGDGTSFSVGEMFAGWSVIPAPASSASGSVTIVSTDYVELGFSFPAQLGEQWLDLTGFGSNQPIGVQQTVSTVAGEIYDLSFWVGNTFNPSGPFGVASTIELLVDSVANSFTNSGGAGTQTTSWSQFSFSFMANSGSTAITFINRDSISDNMNGLDNVVLTRAVPEPYTLGLIGVGLLGLGLARRRKVA